MSDDYSDDEQSIFSSGRDEKIGRLRLQIRSLDCVPDGIPGREIALRESLVHHHDCSAAMSLGFIPESSLHKRDAKHGEIFLADQVQAEYLFCIGGFADNLKMGVEAI